MKIVTQLETRWNIAPYTSSQCHSILEKSFNSHKGAIRIIQNDRMQNAKLHFESNTPPLTIVETIFHSFAKSHSIYSKAMSCGKKYL